MFKMLRQRYLDILASVYIYNEHRGYTSIDRVLEAVRACCPDDHQFIAEVEKHRADERKHYIMFKRWFELKRRRPFEVDRTCGHIDRFVEIMFGRGIDALDTPAIIADQNQFERLCRVIMLTEQRGMRQVDVLLKSPLVKSDSVMMKIFRIIERDEPSHWQPYEAWLKRAGRKPASWTERAVDFWVHRELLLFKIPALFFNPWLARQRHWADADEAPLAARAV